MILLFELGARIDDFFNIRLVDIYRQVTYVQIRLHWKGDKPRYVPLLNDVIPYLNDYLEEFHPDSTKEDFLAYTIHRGRHTQMTAGTVNHLLKNYASIAATNNPLFL